MCIEGTKLVLPENGEFVQEGEAVKEGYYSTFTIKVAKALTDGNEYAIKFQNSEGSVCRNNSDGHSGSCRIIRHTGK